MDNTVIFLMGPTACGKTALAVNLAQHLPVEIISVDSALVYRGMDIGTAKPTAEEQGGVPHHLIDITDPAEPYSAAQFRDDALRLIAEIHGRGRIPLLAGGTMLYFHALKSGLSDLPEADADLRRALEQRARVQGWPALHAELAALDPLTAARLSVNDSQRIQRALEVCLLSGQALSAFAKPSANAFPFRALEIVLMPSDRAVLHARIAARFEAMLDGGFLDEVRALRARGDLHADLPALRAVGYRQAWAHLAGEYDLVALREKGIAATRQLAKRQITWLRSWPQGDDTQVFDCLAADVLAQAQAWLAARLPAF
jgi:tRNA dimethylallyltransferase